MSKNSKIISVSIRPEQHDMLRKAGKIKRQGISELVRNLIDEHLEGTSAFDESVDEWLEEAAQNKDMTTKELANDLLKRYLTPDEKGRSVSAGEAFPVVLKIPVELKGNRQELAKWLQSRARYILEKLG